VREHFVPEYRCDMLYEHGELLFSADIIAENLGDAICHATEIFHANNRSLSSQLLVYLLEIFSKMDRLYPPAG
jgi:hypothetical protein